MLNISLETTHLLLVSLKVLQDFFQEKKQDGENFVILLRHSDSLRHLSHTMN